MSEFTYLNVHTHFSRAGGPASPASWFERARDLGYSSLAVSDRAPLAGWPAAYAAARASGLTLIYGFEADLLLPPETARRGKAEPSLQSALLIAHSVQGARNLAHLATTAYTGWPAVETAIDWPTLASHSAGVALVLLGGDEAGAPQPITSASGKQRDAWAAALKAAFPTTAYIGLPHSDRAGDTALAEVIANAAQSLGLPLVATPPARYLQPDDAPAYESLKLARRKAGWPLDVANPSTITTSVAPDRPGYDYLRPPGEVVALYARWPQAIENTGVIAALASQLTAWPFAPAPSTQGRAYLLETAQSRLAQLSATPDDATNPERLAAELATFTRWGDAAAWIALAQLTSLIASTGTPIPHGDPVGLPANALLAYALGLSPSIPAQPQEQPTESAEIPSPAPTTAIPSIVLPRTGRKHLLQELTADYGSARVAHATCPLDLLPVPALEAAAQVLNLTGDPLRTLLPAAIAGGWQAFDEAAAQHDDSQSASLARLAGALKGVPLSFTPDLDSIVVAPRTAFPDDTLAAWGPTLPYLPWSAQALSSLGYPVLHLPTSAALDAVYEGLALARRYPTPGFSHNLPSATPGELSQALKSGHPAAYVAGALGVAWSRGGSHSISTLADEARKLGVRIDPPHVNYSAEYPTLQRDGDSWSVLWGLATLPGWRPDHACLLISARPLAGFASLAALAEASITAGLTLSHLQTLVLSGALDTLGDRPRDRHALLSSLPSMLEWAKAQSDLRSASQLSLFAFLPSTPPVETDLGEDNAQTTFGAPTSAPRSPQARYAQHTWEEHNIGLVFTQAPEMDALKLILEKSGGLRSRLTSTHQVAAEPLRRSIYLAGILTNITLLPGEGGDTLAIAHLEDLHGSLELVALPPNYRRHSALWTENNSVLVTARIEAHPDGDVYLLCEQLAPFTASGADDNFTITIKPIRAPKSAAAKPTPPPQQPAYYSSQTATTPQPPKATQHKPDLKLVPP
ncbi:MAG: PHP domain-containing protein, partial [Chloroflexota bacterium]